jgi:hypothetical protein
MAISTMDGLVANIKAPQPIFKAASTGQGSANLHSSLYTAGNPGAAALPAPGINGASLTAYAGQIPVPAPVGGATIYLTGLGMVSTGIAGAYFLDRLWHNSGIVVTTTTAQAITTPVWPSRDAIGQTSGVSLGIALEVTATIGTAAPVTTITVAYTNSGGTAGRTATLASLPTAAVTGAWVPLTLQAGDVGVASIQSVTLGTSLVSGSVSLVVYRQVAELYVPGDNIGGHADFAALNMPILFDNSVPWLVYMLTTTAIGRVVGTVNYAQG